MTLRRLESFIGRTVLDLTVLLCMTTPGQWLIYRAAEPSDRLMLAGVIATAGGYYAAKAEAWIGSKRT